MNRKFLALVGLTAIAAGSAWWWLSAPPAATPTLLTLLTFGDFGGHWGTRSPSAPLTYQVLPLATPGMGLELVLTAPRPSTLAVMVTDQSAPPAPLGTFTLPEIMSGQAEPATGFFRVDGVDNTPPVPQWFITVRPPDTFPMKPATRYLIGIADVSANRMLTGTKHTSPPLNIVLESAPNYTVTVQIVGSGHVTSSPPGISCGTSQASCQFMFGPGPVTLNPNSDPGSKFLGWSGNCVGFDCVVALMGSPAAATATFGPASAPPLTTSTCPTAPQIAGFVWRSTPMCSNRLIHEDVSCDAQGYFCCDPSSAPDPHQRCSGNNLMTPADCGIGTEAGTRLMLFQPGGCYEWSTTP